MPVKEPGLRRRAVRGVAWTSAQLLVSRILGAIVFVILARLITPEDFGLIAIASVFLSLLGILVQQGFSRALVQRTEVHPAHLDTAFWLSVGTGVVLAGGLAAVAPLLARLFDESDLAPVLVVLSVTLVLAAPRSVPTSLLQRRLAFRALALRTFVAVVLSAVVGVWLAFAGLGVWALVAQALTESATSTVLVCVQARWRPGNQLRRWAFRDLFGFSNRLLAMSLCQFLTRHADDFLIGLFLGPVALGFYSVGYRFLILLTSLLLQTIERVAFPVFSRLKDEPSRLADAYLTATQLSLIVTLPACAGLVVVAPDFIPVVFGELWTPAVPVMQVLCGVTAVNSLLFFNTTVLTSKGYPSRALLVIGASAACNVIGFAVAVRFGIVAVAFASLIGVCLLSPLPILMVRRLIPFELGQLARKALAPVLATAGMASALVALRLALGDVSPATKLAWLLPAGVLVYPSLLWLLDRQSCRALYNDFTSLRASDSKRAQGPGTDPTLPADSFSA